MRVHAPQGLEKGYMQMLAASDAALGIEDGEGPVAARSSMMELLTALK